MHTTVIRSWAAGALAAGLLLAAAPAARAQSLSAGDAGVARRGEPPAGRDAVGTFALANGYAILLLDTGPAPADRRFHLDTATLAFKPQAVLAGDWDGDDSDTLGIHERALGTFHLASLNATGDPDLVFAFGEPDTLPVAGDFDGDGVDTVGTWDRVTGAVELRDENAAGPPDVEFVFGPFGPPPMGEQPGPVPLAADWNGDGIDSIGVYDPATATFHLRFTNSSGPADLELVFGPGLPLAGDWNGDGTDTVGVLATDGDAFLLRNQNAPGPADVVVPVPSHALAWAPVAGDWSTAGTLDEHDGYPWPLSTPAAEGMDGELLAEAVSRAAAVPAFHGLLVARHGKMVTEAFFNDWDGTIGQCVKSVSKSILSTLYAIAWDQGAIDGLDTTLASLAPSYFPRPDPLKESITVENMLTMTAGLDWPPDDDLSAMLASPDWVADVLGRPMATTPGSSFLYSTGLTHAASAILEIATGSGTAAFAEQQLFAPIGIEAVRWDHDPQGFDFGGAEVYLRPRDMLRFGQVVLDGGLAGTRQVIPQAWIEMSTSPLVNAGSYGYGFWWWTGTFGGQPAAFAWGYGGQFVFVFAGLDLVVVATSDWQVSQQDADTQYAEIFDIVGTLIVPAVGDA